MSTSISAPDSRLAVRDPADIIEAVVLQGDLARLQPAQRVSYYRQTCHSLGLNPLTKPFDYINLNGKLTLYATKSATDQLRELHGVSITRLEFKTVGDIYCTTAYAQDKTGRTDSSTGAVAIAGLRGEALANAFMKCETKAKRRVTLSICGLGWTDESELGTIPDAQSVDVDPETGEIDTRPRDRVGKLLERYGMLLSEARNAGLVTDAKDWILPSGASEAFITNKGEALAKLLKEARSSGDNQAPRSAPGDVASPPARPADLERSRLWAERRQQEIKGGELGVPVRTLNSRIATEDLTAEVELTRAQIKSVEEDLVAEPEEQESLV